jgi:hypothetical protein
MTKTFSRMVAGRRRSVISSRCVPGRAGIFRRRPPWATSRRHRIETRLHPVVDVDELDVQDLLRHGEHPEHGVTVLDAVDAHAERQGVIDQPDAGSRHAEQKQAAHHRGIAVFLHGKAHYNRNPGRMRGGSMMRRTGAEA